MNKTITVAVCLLTGGMLMAMTEKDRALVSVAAETARGDLAVLERAYAMLAAIGNVKPQLEAHICIAKRNGVSEEEIEEIPANVEHWHGAAPDSWFAHLAIETNPKENVNTWLEPVSDADYQEAMK